MAAERLLDAYRDVLAVFMPEIAPMFGFDQHSKYHDSDVWEHSLRAFAAVKEKNPPLRLAALLHDIGKPCSFTQDEDGTGHFLRPCKAERFACARSIKPAALRQHHKASRAHTD